MLKKSFIPSLFLIASTTAFADISYNFVQLSFVDSGDIETESVSFAGSFEINESIFVFGEYSDGEFDDLPVDIDATNFGVGGHTPINNNTDVVFGISYLEGELEGLGETIDVDGHRLWLGLISEVSDNLEVQANFFRDDIDIDSNINGSASDTDTTWSVQARYAITDTLKLNLGLGEDEVVSLGFRLDI